MAVSGQTRKQTLHVLRVAMCHATCNYDQVAFWNLWWEVTVELS